MAGGETGPPADGTSTDGSGNAGAGSEKAGSGLNEARHGSQSTGGGDSAGSSSGSSGSGGSAGSSGSGVGGKTSGGSDSGTASTSASASASALAGSVGPGQLLRLLVPSTPFIALQDQSRLVVSWRPLRRAVESLQAEAPLPVQPRMFALWMDGVSVYSGQERAHGFQLPLAAGSKSKGWGRSRDCHVFRVAAFYHHLGWTGLSPALRVGRDCDLPEEVLLPHRSSLQPEGSEDGVPLHADRAAQLAMEGAASGSISGAGHAHAPGAQGEPHAGPDAPRFPPGQEQDEHTAA